MIPRFNYECDDQNTGNQTDDEYAVSLTVDNAYEGTFDLSGSINESGLNYNETYNNRWIVPANGSMLSITVSDPTIEDCAQTFILGPLEHCSLCPDGNCFEIQVIKQDKE